MCFFLFFGGGEFFSYPLLLLFFVFFFVSLFRFYLLFLRYKSPFVFCWFTTRKQKQANKQKRKKKKHIKLKPFHVHDCWRRRPRLQRRSCRLKWEKNKERKKFEIVLKNNIKKEKKKKKNNNYCLQLLSVYGVFKP